MKEIKVTDLSKSKKRSTERRRRNEKLSIKYKKLTDFTEAEKESLSKHAEELYNGIEWT